MLYDITLLITPELCRSAPEKDDRALLGHLGTHFDVMDKEFPLEYTERRGILFDVSHVEGEEIGVGDVDLSRVFITHSGMTDPTLVDKVKDAVLAIAPFEDVQVTRAGCTVSNHCGPNTLGVLFCRK